MVKRTKSGGGVTQLSLDGTRLIGVTNDSQAQTPFSAFVPVPGAMKVTAPTIDVDLMPKMTGKTDFTGTMYVPSWLPNYSYVSWLQLNQEITSQKLFNLMGHWAFRKTLNKQMNMIFTETKDMPIRIEVKNRTGKIDDTSVKLQQRLHDTMMMNPRVDLVNKMRMGFADVFSHGMNINTWLWKRNKEKELVLESLIRLPIQSFDYPPIGQPLVFSPVLQGVTLHRDETTGLNTGEIEFWQRISVFNFVPMKLETENLFWVKDPLGLELAGDPICRPIVPIVEMISYAMNTQMQYLNRTGAPWTYMKVTNPQGPNSLNGGVGDVDFALQVLQNQNKDNKYVLRPNMDLVPVVFGNDTGASTAALATVESLNQIVVDVFTPKESVMQNTGASLGGYQGAAQDLYAAYIQSMQAYISREWSRVPQYDLSANGWDDPEKPPEQRYIATIVFPMSEGDKGQLKTQQAMIGMESGIVDPVAFLEKLDYDIDEEHASEENLLKHAEFWGKVAEVMGKKAPAMQGGLPVQGEEAGAQIEAAATATLKRITGTPTRASILEGDVNRAYRQSLDILAGDVMRIVESGSAK